MQSCFCISIVTVFAPASSLQYFLYVSFLVWQIAFSAAQLFFNQEIAQIRFFFYVEIFKFYFFALFKYQHHYDSCLWESNSISSTLQRQKIISGMYAKLDTCWCCLFLLVLICIFSEIPKLVAICTFSSTGLSCFYLCFFCCSFATPSVLLRVHFWTNCEVDPSFFTFVTGTLFSRKF